MRARTVFILGAIIVVAVSRALPHPANFAPMCAMALFGAATLRDRKLALVAPLISLFASDLVLGLLYWLGLSERWGFYPAMWGVYGAMLAVTALGFLLRRRSSPVWRTPWIAGVGIVGACLYFAVTNFAWWVSSDLYPLTGAGLLQCYIEALPFFRVNLVGDAFYLTVLFGGLALCQLWVPALREPALSPSVEPARQPITV
jgi:hypothetical protein